MGAIWVLIQKFGQGFYDLFYALFHPGLWLDWSEKTSIINFIYYGASHEFLFVMFDIVIVLTIIGLLVRPFLWRLVQGMEFVSNTVGRFFAWAGLIMVLQQILIVFLQRIFRVSEISISPLGYAFTRDLSWYGEELKLYNAMIVTLCVAYTFIQGGHVRVDLFYAGMRHRSKKIVDMLGSLLFILPLMSVMWMYSWFFLWRSLVVPNPSASDTLEKLMLKARILRWNVETIGFSPNGFDAYFLFKILMVAFAGFMFFQGIAYFWRSLLEFIEGEDSADKYLDKDELGDEIAETAAAIH